jgi:hypothetical protein
MLFFLPTNRRPEISIVCIDALAPFSDLHPYYTPDW